MICTGKDIKEEHVEGILLRLRTSMKKLLQVSSILSHLKKWKVLLESEEELLSSSIYDSGEQVSG